MVEPEIAENTVPATTATTASRPGTCRIRCSTPSITFTASPVWNSTSPMRMKSGMGVSEKLATDPTELRANWRSEERRVGKECRAGWVRWQLKERKNVGDVGVRDD